MLGRNDFVGVIRNAVAGQGLSPEIAMVTFPIALFLVESDLTPVRQEFGKFIEALTAWKPQGQPRATISKPPPVAIEFEDPLQFHARCNSLFLKRNWSDGLPLVPPTRDIVRWVLQGSDATPDTPIGTMYPRGAIVTVETAAVALAMAGGRPEYLPVLVAALEALFDPALMHANWQATSCSTFPVVMVGGPIAQEIKVNSGFGLLGPDPRHPAGGCIGRALRLLQQNVGGALPGESTMAMFGAMRYTNAVFAEDVAGLPSGWKPFHEDYLGFAPGDNSVGLLVASGATNILRRGVGTETAEREAQDGLHRIASYMRAINVNTYEGYRDGPPGLLLISRPVANQMAELGWSQDKIRQFLWDHSKIPVRELEQAGIPQWLARYGEEATLAQDPWPITPKPGNLAIMVAGGGHPTHAFWMQSAFAPKVAKAKIRLPACWSDLLARAREAG